MSDPNPSIAARRRTAGGTRPGRDVQQQRTIRQADSPPAARSRAFDADHRVAQIVLTRKGGERCEVAGYGGADALLARWLTEKPCYADGTFCVHYRIVFGDGTVFEERLDLLGDADGCAHAQPLSLSAIAAQYAGHYAGRRKPASMQESAWARVVAHALDRGRMAHMQQLLDGYEIG